jgi:RimJ/RimL family protein N-acetyltransferase
MPIFVQMRTPRLLLTAVAMADLAEFHALHSDPELYQHSLEALSPDVEHSRSLIEGYESDWAEVGLGYWTVRNPEGVYLGCAGVRRGGSSSGPSDSRLGGPAGSWNVYYRLHKSAWGHGYAAEVIRLAAECVEVIEPGAVLQAAIRPANAASAAVAEHLGMIFCGSQLDYAGTEDLIYQLPADEFE